MSLPISYIEVLSSVSTVFGNRSFIEVRKLKWDHMGGPNPI